MNNIIDSSNISSNNYYKNNLERKKNIFIKKMFHKIKESFINNDIKNEIKNEIIAPIYEEIYLLILPHYITFILFLPIPVNFLKFFFVDLFIIF